MGKGSLRRYPFLSGEYNAAMVPAELIFRVFGITLFALLSLFLLRAKSHELKIQAGAWLAASVGAFLLTSMPGAAEFLGAFVYLLTALCSTHAVWFWLFCMALFSDGATLRRGHVVCLVSMALAGVLYQSAYDGGEASANARALGLVFSAAWLAFACLAPFSVFLGASADLDPRRRRIRRWFVPGVSLYLAIVVVTQCVMLFRGHSTPTPLILLNLVVLDAAAVLAVSTFLRVRVHNWLEMTDGAPAIVLTRLEQHVLDNLTRRFATERLYAREALTITELASLLGTQEHLLRRVINQGLGFKNFNDFLHHHRLKEAAGRLRDPAAQRIPVLTIALEAGYGSVGPFNRAFKERFGLTPTEFRRVPLADFEIGKNPRAFG